MEVLRDDLCFILDLEGFFTYRKFFHARELGCYTWNQEHGRHAFFIPTPYKALNNKDRSTVHFVCNKIHGLSYQPTQAEHDHHPMLLKSLVKNLYQKYKTNKRTVVGYKGGHVEKDSLQVGLPQIRCIENSVSQRIIITQLFISQRRQSSSLSRDRMSCFLEVV